MGIETNYGTYVGKMDILSSLATLSFDQRRSRFFTNELLILLKLIDKTKFAVSNEETRYYLNGIFLHKADRNSIQFLRAVATDGHRLAQYDIPLPQGAEEITGIIIPKKTIYELSKLLRYYLDRELLK